MSKDCCSVSEEAKVSSKKKKYAIFIPSFFSFILLILGLFFDHFFPLEWFTNTFRLFWYFIAYLPVGYPVLLAAIKSIRKKDIFSEFFLMSIATIGAFSIGEYPEGVAVMLFYAVGESFQHLAVSRAKANIKLLLDQRPDETTVLIDDRPVNIPAEQVAIGDVIQLKVGEKLALDGVLLSDRTSFNTAALTGESKPDTKTTGDIVLAGMINLGKVIQVQVTTAYEDSKLSRILNLVQEASAQKAPTELFIRKFARIYTPVVVLLAVAICFIPYFFVQDYEFKTWLYRSLIFLVISCPCALVISIPLGYFGGIGAGSRNGILFKGGGFLDKMASIQNVVMDKTGTMTEGIFAVQEVVFDEKFDKEQVLSFVNALESLSNHPVATAMHQFVGPVDPNVKLENTEEIAGYGLKALVEGKELLVGNFRLLDKHQINYDFDPSSIVYTLIAVAYGGEYVGYITIADKIKSNAKHAIKQLHSYGIRTTMLSGDKDNVVQYVAQELGVDEAWGDLLPEDKVNRVSAIKKKNQSVAFVGDGINDAPVVALSDVGIAMGGLGADVTIETADIIIQDDNPAKIAMAVSIGKQTKRIVWQNITLAFVVKAIVMLLGAEGIASMWEAVFADVGVALLAILNAVRIQRIRF